MNINKKFKDFLEIITGVVVFVFIYLYFEWYNYKHKNKYIDGTIIGRKIYGNKEKSRN